MEIGSKLLNFFSVLTPNSAKCDLCQLVYSVKGRNEANLKRHLLNKHNVFQSKPRRISTVPQAVSMEKRSLLWNFFSSISADSAMCGLCQAAISIKGGSIGNLKRHLHKKHLSSYNSILECKNRLTFTIPWMKEASLSPKAENVHESNEMDFIENLSLCTSQKITHQLEKYIGYQRICEINKSLLLHFYFAKTMYLVMGSKRRSMAWQYFTALPNRKAQCSICNQVLSYNGGGPFNLTRHIKSKHLKMYARDQADLQQSASSQNTASAPVTTTETTGIFTPSEPPASDPIASSTPRTTTIAGPSQPTVQIPIAPLVKKQKIFHKKSFKSSYISQYKSKYQPEQDDDPPPPRKNQRLQQDRDAHICSSCPCIAAQESEFDKIGKAWASELQKMNREQQIYAKRAIAEIIFEGQLGALHRDSVIINHIEQRVVNESSPVIFVEKEEPDYD